MSEERAPKSGCYRACGRHRRDGRTGANRRRTQREPKQVEHPAPPAPVDKRDSVVAAPSAFTGRPYWLALAQCGGIYFKLNVLYTDIAVHARAVKPDPRINTEYTKKLNDAIKTATSISTARIVS